MTTLRHEIRIAASVDAVWRAVAGDLTAVQHYNPMVSSARLLSERPDGVGATRRCELNPNGFVEERVWEWTPSRSVGLEVAASEWPLRYMRWKTELSPNGEETVVRQEMRYELKYGAVGTLLDALMMRRRLDRGIREVFSNLKRYVEAESPAATPAVP